MQRGGPSPAPRTRYDLEPPRPAGRAALASEVLIGQEFHITSDAALAWDQIPQILNVPSDAIVAGDPSELRSLFGDKVYSTVFDNSKLRGVVPATGRRSRSLRGSPRRSPGSMPTLTAGPSTKPPTSAGTTSPPSTRRLWPERAERTARDVAWPTGLAPYA